MRRVVGEKQTNKQRAANYSLVISLHIAITSIDINIEFRKIMGINFLNDLCNRESIVNDVYV